jgi:hypothetical protein
MSKQSSLVTPLWDTPKDQEVSVSMDIGIVPPGYPGAGKHVITVQLWPIANIKEAEILARAVREALQSRLGVTMERQAGVG